MGRSAPPLPCRPLLIRHAQLCTLTGADLGGSGDSGQPPPPPPPKKKNLAPLASPIFPSTSNPVSVPGEFSTFFSFFIVAHCLQKKIKTT